MLCKFNNSNRNSMPEQGGTGIARMPEQGGTGLTRVPEQGGTGLSRGLFALLLLLALPLAPAMASDKDGIWNIHGEIDGYAQVRIDPDQQISMSFMLADADGATRLYLASGVVKNDFGRLSVFRADLSDGAALVDQGTMDVFLTVCGADAEWQPKSENEGTGGKAITSQPLSRIFSMSKSTSECLQKSENEGTGAP